MGLGRSRTDREIGYSIVVGRIGRGRFFEMASVDPEDSVPSLATPRKDIRSARKQPGHLLTRPLSYRPNSYALLSRTVFPIPYLIRGVFFSSSTSSSQQLRPGRSKSRQISNGIAPSIKPTRDKSYIIRKGRRNVGENPDRFCVDAKARIIDADAASRTVRG